MDAAEQWLLDAIKDHASQEWSVITSAPGALVLCVSAAGLVIWFAVHLFYRQEIKVLKARHVAKDEFIERLQRQLSAAEAQLYEGIKALKTENAEMREEIKKEREIGIRMRTHGPFLGGDPNKK